MPPEAHYMCFVWQEVCDQAAMSGVWHSGLHDTGQDCKAATPAGLDRSPGTCKEGMPCNLLKGLHVMLATLSST